MVSLNKIVRLVCLLGGWLGAQIIDSEKVREVQGSTVGHPHIEVVLIFMGV